jgi:hypothetical protein
MGASEERERVEALHGSLLGMIDSLRSLAAAIPGPDDPPGARAEGLAAAQQEVDRKARELAARLGPRAAE